MKTKRCTKCRETKPISEFSRTKAKKDGYNSHCKVCRRKYHKEVVAPYHIKRNQDLKRQYGISFKEYDVLFKKQNGCCAICGRPETTMFRGRVKHLFVDHNHITGKVRGLLCSICNMKIGVLEQLDFIVKAKKYLEENV